ncbi:hypothetical protein Tco_0116319 [Tanacetum coccineum]
MKEDQAGSDPGKSCVALAGPNPEPTLKDFMAHVYPNVHESLKFPADEHVILEDPLSSFANLSSIKNLDDAYNIGDQFIDDKSTEDELGKLNVESEIVYMVSVPVYQADTSVPPLSTLVIEISSPISSSHPVHAPIIIATTVTTSTTLALPPPPPTQSSTDPELAARVSTLEKRNAELEQAFTNQNKTTNNLTSRIFTLEHHDLEYRIENYVRETVKQNRIVESGSYKNHTEHADLYKALERSMARDNMDEFIAEKAKSQKRRHNDQDPPQPPPQKSDQSKKKKHDTDASASRPYPPQTSSAWKTIDTKDAPSSSSKQHQASQSEQPIDDVLTFDVVYISNSKDVGAAHLPKIKTPATWLRPLPEEDKPENPAENKLLRKIGNMGSFIKWFCKRLGKKKLSKSDLEGPAFKVVKAFHENNISLQFQMEECHRLLTDQVDLVNPEGHRFVPDVSKPLPLGGAPGDTASRAALLISKLKAANYPDFRLEELVSSLWIESECDYNISAAYGITHWWFKRKEFYITRHNASSDRYAVRSHMRILSVISLKKFERYGYAFLKRLLSTDLTTKSTRSQKLTSKICI